MKNYFKYSGLLSLCLVLSLTQCRDSQRFYTNTLRSDIFTQLFSTDQYDFLWVFDNSDSMSAKRDFVKDELNTFINILNSRKAIDYQMAVTTTDYFTHQGNLIQGDGGVEVVTSKFADPVASFASIINNVTDSFTSFWEQGLESAYQAISRHGSKFLRAGVPLIIIFLTDEQDYSCASNCFGVEPENNTSWVPHATSRYMDYFREVKESEGTTTSVFPIVGVNSGTCSVASLGTRYEEVQTDIDEEASTGSICNAELAESYQAIAKNIADRGTSFCLASTSSGEGFIVLVNSEKIPYSPDNGYVFDKTTNCIVFTGSAIPQNGDSVEIAYSEARS